MVLNKKYGELRISNSPYFLQYFSECTGYQRIFSANILGQIILFHRLVRQAKNDQAEGQIHKNIAAVINSGIEIRIGERHSHQAGWFQNAVNGDAADKVDHKAADGTQHTPPEQPAGFSFAESAQAQRHKGHDVVQQDGNPTITYSALDKNLEQAEGSANQQPPAKAPADAEHKQRQHFQRDGPALGTS